MNMLNQHGLMGAQNLAYNRLQGGAEFLQQEKAVLRRVQQNNAVEDVAIQKKQEIKTMTGRRLVQVFIADPNENVPLDSSMIYVGEQKLTDSNDQELFFELDIKNLLDKHNEKRTKMIDKKVKERTEYLEPVKIRELKMVVVTVAQF
jgi:hypothetical protein